MKSTCLKHLRRWLEARHIARLLASAWSDWHTGKDPKTFLLTPSVRDPGAWLVTPQRSPQKVAQGHLKTELCTVHVGAIWMRHGPITPLQSTREYLVLGYKYQCSFLIFDLGLALLNASATAKVISRFGLVLALLTATGKIQSVELFHLSTLTWNPTEQSQV